MLLPPKSSPSFSLSGTFVTFHQTIIPEFVDIFNLPVCSATCSQDITFDARDRFLYRFTLTTWSTIRNKLTCDKNSLHIFQANSSTPPPPDMIVVAGSFPAGVAVGGPWRAFATASIGFFYGKDEVPSVESLFQSNNQRFLNKLIP